MKTLKYVLVILVCFILVLISACQIFVNTQYCKTALISIIESETPFKLNIGKLKILLLPNINFYAYKSRISPADGRNYFIEFEEIYININIFRLLKGNLAINEIKIKEPFLNIKHGQSGNSNVRSDQKNEKPINAANYNTGTDRNKKNNNANVDEKKNTWSIGLKNILINRVNIENGYFVYMKDYENSSIVLKMGNVGVTGKDINLEKEINLKAQAVAGDNIRVETDLNVTNKTKIKAVTKLYGTNTGDIKNILTIEIPKYLIFNDLNADIITEGSLGGAINNSFKIETADETSSGIKTTLSGSLFFDETQKKSVFKGEVNIERLFMELPYVELPLEFTSGSISFNENGLDVSNLAMNDGISDMTVNAKIKNYRMPNIQINGKSKNTSIDQLYSANKPKFYEASEKETAAAGKRSQETEPSSKEYTDQKEKSAPAKPAERRIRDRSVLDKLSVNGIFEFDNLKYKQNEAKNVKADINFSNNTLKINNISADVYGGEIKGCFEANCAYTVSLLSSEFECKNINIHDFLVSNTDFSNVYGTLNGDMSLKSEGDIVENILSGLNGTGNLKVDSCKVSGWNLKNGILYNLNVPSILWLLPGVKNAQKLSQDETNETNFGQIVLNTAIKDKTLFLENFECKTPDVYMVGGGTINLSLELNFKLQALLSQSLTALLTQEKELPPYIPSQDGRLIVPFTISGNIEKPIIIPDIKILMERAADGMIREQFEKYLKK